MGRFPAITGVCVGVITVLAGCIAPSTKGVTVDKTRVDQEREYQIELTLQQQLKYQQRLDDAAWPLYRAALPLCQAEFVSYQSGFDVASVEDFPKEYRPSATKLLGMDESLRVLSVVKNTTAAHSGLQPGDQIVLINGAPVIRGKNASRQFFQQLTDYFKFNKTASLQVDRRGVKHEIRIDREELCYFHAQLSMSDDINAYADGQRVVITKGMLRFTETDLELATVIAHEIGHNLMEHMDAKKNNYWLGIAADIAAALAGINTQGSFGRMGATAYSQEFEAEADYVSVYILALGKYEIESVAKFWRRMAAEHPRGIKENHGASHPSTPERFVAIEETVHEVRTKEKAGFPLRPDRQ